MKQDKLPNGFIEVTIIKIDNYGDKIRFKTLLNVHYISVVNLNSCSCSICMQNGTLLMVEEEYEKIIDYIKESQLR